MSESRGNGCLAELGSMLLTLTTWMGIVLLFRHLNPEWGWLVGVVTLPLSFQLGTTCASVVLFAVVGLHAMVWLLKVPFRAILRRPLIREGEEDLLVFNLIPVFIAFGLGAFVTGALAGLIVSTGEHAVFSHAASSLAGGAVSTIACFVFLRLGIMIE